MTWAPRRPNAPRRAPGTRKPIPEGMEPGKKREKSGKPRPAPAPRVPQDHVLRRFARGYEDAESLQGTAEIAADFMRLGGHEPLFGVSSWIVSDVSEPLPEGYARVSALVAAGFGVVSTPEFIGRGHVTILLTDPVTDDQAEAFNECFGRSP